MTEIRYYTSKEGHNNCFGISFERGKCISSAFSEENGKFAELRFFVFLLKKFGMYNGNNSGETLMWNTYFHCEYDGMPFDMIYDNDYDIVTFSVKPENAKYRTIIAEKIKSLVEEKQLRSE